MREKERHYIALFQVVFNMLFEENFFVLLTLELLKMMRKITVVDESFLAPGKGVVSG